MIIDILVATLSKVDIKHCKQQPGLNLNDPCTNSFGTELVLGAMDVEQRCDPYKQPPPRPVLHAEELAHIALDTAHCQLLNLSQTQQIQY